MLNRNFLLKLLVQIRCFNEISRQRQLTKQAGHTSPYSYFLLPLNSIASITRTIIFMQYLLLSSQGCQISVCTAQLSRILHARPLRFWEHEQIAFTKFLADQSPDLTHAIKSGERQKSNCNRSFFFVLIGLKRRLV